MSSQPDPKSKPGSSFSDEELLHVHEESVAHTTDDGGSYKLLPLVLLFAFSGLIFFGGTYLNLFSGHFDPRIFDERALPHSGQIEMVKLDPVVYGKKLYESLCINCHQPTGLGVPGTFPPLAGSEWVNGPEDRIIRILEHGLQGPLTVKGNNFGAVPMPAVGAGGAGWSDDKIAAVLTYVRQAFGNNSPPVTEEKVTEIRNQVGTHAPWLPADLSKIP